ncbi:MAG: bifunctional folylpolyglutamate synthase/dihydrofolate synthase [Oscillospiraceae bacterium]|nr:bifunctional folylpolyglutamate synthase/dihydrofolate synthase [Oscillospiraceae bacterium]
MPNPYLSGTDPTVIRPGLSRCAELLNRLGRPQERLRYVHVAGTNGKGSTAACIASILRCAGYRTGLFTSPALEDFSERVQVNGQPIPPESLTRLSAEVRAAAGAMTDSPTEFELATALALLYFAQEGCDLAVLEVGVGGGEDATNVIPPPEVAVLTAMGLDHTQLLGNTLEEIAAAKAGILKPGSAAVSYGNEPVCNAVFAARCEQLGIPLVQADFSRIQNRSVSLEGGTFQLAPYGTLTLPLLGEYQMKNTLLAVTATEALQARGWSIPPEAVRAGVASVRWPGRLELLRKEPTVLLDGSHNPQGLRATVESLQEILPEKPVILMGVMADKDVAQMLELLLPVAQSFVTVTAPNPRAMDAETLARQIRARGGAARACASVEEGAEAAIALAGSSGSVCALGTLYFSAAVRHAVFNIR